MKKNKIVRYNYTKFYEHFHGSNDDAEDSGPSPGAALSQPLSSV